MLPTADLLVALQELEQGRLSGGGGVVAVRLRQGGAQGGGARRVIAGRHGLRHLARIQHVPAGREGVLDLLGLDERSRTVRGRIGNDLLDLEIGGSVHECRDGPGVRKPKTRCIVHFGQGRPRILSVHTDIGKGRRAGDEGIAGGIRQHRLIGHIVRGADTGGIVGQDPFPVHRASGRPRILDRDAGRERGRRRRAGPGHAVGGAGTIRLIHLRDAEGSSASLASGSRGIARIGEGAGHLRGGNNLGHGGTIGIPTERPGPCREAGAWGGRGRGLDRGRGS